MMLALVIHAMMQADCNYRLTDKWHAFVKNHIIDDDPYDEHTREKKDQDDDANRGKGV